MSLGCCTGDQADQKLLDKILADSKAFGGYDIIIDDGGHTVNQMLTSIKVHPPCKSDAYLLPTPYTKSTPRGLEMPS